jgi:hypothetical protein
MSQLRLALTGLRVGDLTKRETFRLNWEAWSHGLPDQRNVVIIGWPLVIAPTALSNIHTVCEMKKLLAAVVEKTCYFDIAGGTLARGEGDNLKVDKCKSFSLVICIIPT